MENQNEDGTINLDPSEKYIFQQDGKQFLSIDLNNITDRVEIYDKTQRDVVSYILPIEEYRDMLDEIGDYESELHDSEVVYDE